MHDIFGLHIEHCVVGGARDDSIFGPAQNGKCLAPLVFRGHFSCTSRVALQVDCIVATAGGVEEDFIKCLAPTFIGSFELRGQELRAQGINRIGNLLVPNDNYCKFETWVLPLLDEMLTDQKEKHILWTPSKIIQRLGERINDETSIYYWAAKNKIPVFSPALTDGSLGDMMYFHSHRNPGLVVDILSDLRRLNTMAVKAINSGMIIVGGGLIKHHICNANLMVNRVEFNSLFLVGEK